MSSAAGFKYLVSLPPGPFNETWWRYFCHVTPYAPFVVFGDRAVAHKFDTQKEADAKIVELQELARVSCGNYEQSRLADLQVQSIRLPRLCLVSVMVPATPVVVGVPAGLSLCHAVLAVMLESCDLTALREACKPIWHLQFGDRWIESDWDASTFQILAGFDPFTTGGSDVDDAMTDVQYCPRCASPFFMLTRNRAAVGCFACNEAQRLHIELAAYQQRRQE